LCTLCLRSLLCTGFKTGKYRAMAAEEEAVTVVVGEATESLKSEPMPLGLVKAYYFASFCFYATHYRYLTLYFEADGLSASQIGMLWSVQRVIGSVGTPFWAALADRTKKARSIVQWSLAFSILPFLALAMPLAADSYKIVPRAAALWFFGIVGSPQSALRDALAIAACAGDSDLWGKARVYGAIGWGLMHLLLGPLLDAAGFAALFSCFMVFAVMLFLVTRVSVPQACGQAKKEVTTEAILNIFRQNRLFFVNIAAIGAGFSMVEGMLFLLLQELNASNLLCGLAVVVTVIFELPIFHYAKPIIATLGTRKMILLGQLAWVVRAIFYANMTEAWTVLLIEPLHGVTFALVWTAATQHVADPAISGEGLEASAQGLLQVCFMGIGPVLGLSIGGWLFQHLGSHAVYGVFSVIILAIGLAYAVWGGGEASSYGVAIADETKVDTIGHRTLPLSEGDAIIDDIDCGNAISSYEKAEASDYT